MPSRTARAHRRKRYSNPFMDEYMPCIGPEGGLTFCAPLIRDDRPLYSAAGTTAMSTHDVDADGTIPNFWQDNLLRGATLNVPRITGDGVLSEVQSQNVCLQSEALNVDGEGSPWTHTRVSVTANSDTAPDGEAAADRIVEDTDSATTHSIRQTIDFDGSSFYTLSFYLKAGTRNRVQCYLDSARFAGAPVAQFNTATGAVASSEDCTADMQDVGGGYYRCWMSAESDVAASGLIYFYLANDAGSITYNGNGSYLTVWGVQCEAQSAPTSYIPTTSAAVTRSADRIAYAAGANINASAFTVILSVGMNEILAPDGVILDTRSAINPYPGFRIGFDYSELAFIASVQGQNSLAGTTTVERDTRYVVAFAVATNDARIYINGTEEDAETTYAAPASHSTIEVGSYAPSGAINANASYKHLCIYNRALSAAAIQHILHEDYIRWLAGTGWAPAA